MTENRYDLDKELGEAECDPARDRVNVAAQAFLDALDHYDEVKSGYVKTMHLGLNGAGQWVPGSLGSRARLAVEELVSEGEVSPRIDWLLVPAHLTAAPEAQVA